MKTFLFRRGWLSLPIIASLLVGFLLFPGSRTQASGVRFTFHPAAINAGMVAQSITPPSDASCRATRGRPCYSPQEIRNAYGITPLLRAGYTGKGQTIVIIDSFGSPTVRQDLRAFDAGYGLPDPPSFQVLSPLGTVPFNPNDPDQLSWAFETNLDVQWAHAIAPGANIVLLTSPTDETQGVQGMPEFLRLEQYALNHHLGQILSQSWGTSENDLFSPSGKQVLNNFEKFYVQAAQSHLTVLAAAGDWGSPNLDLNSNYNTIPTALFPASSPYVTGVGGTSLSADTNGNYQGEVVWNSKPRGFDFATGGGISQYFSEPAYQKSLPPGTQRLLSHYRGFPDIAYSADSAKPVLVYASYLSAGFYSTGGTSLGSPQWGGIVALANQYAHRPLGFINPALYLLGTSPFASRFFHDVTIGNNSGVNGVPGYNAGPGWDACTGFGSPKTEALVKALATIPS